MMRKIGLKRPSKLNLGPKKVSPPTVPGDQSGHRISGVYSECGLSGISEGLDVSFDSVHSESLGLYRDDRSQTSGSSSGYGGSGGSTVQSEPLPEYRLAARHSSFQPGSRRQSHSSLSSHTLVSTPSSVGSPHDLSPTKASRCSLTSLDSGWASHTNPGPGHLSSFTSHEDGRRLSTISSSSSVMAPPRTSSISSATFRGSSESVASSRCSQSELYRSGSRHHRYSSNSSLGSSRNGEDRICTMDIRQMIEQGLPDLEIVNCWLTDLRFEEYFGLFAAAGYDIFTISRMTPEDLTAIGIKKPHHRKKLKSEIEKLKLPDWLPRHVPESVEEMMHLLRLNQYISPLLSQGYSSVKDVLSISIEDLEDIGFYQLGHQKCLLLGIKRVKELRTGKLQSIAEYQPEELAMSSLPPTLNSKQSFSSFHGSPGLIYFLFAPHTHNLPDTVLGSKTQQSNQLWFPDPAQSDPGPPHQQPDMPTPMEPFNHHFYQTFRPLPAGGPPQVFNIHGVTQQKTETPNSSSSVWQKFPSVQESVQASREPDIWVQRSGHTNSGTLTRSRPELPSCGSLPRPTATVKPLSVMAGSVPVVSEDACSDYNMPFASERLGTIRLKTNPQEREGETCERTKENNVSLLRTPTRAQGRSASDVMDDISCMLADLTTELDSMLCSDSVAQSP